ncbi:peptidase dimerization domain-containing protein [Streptomyces sp. NE06-03E]|uniref:peptidase dimerization domain-containing protein n=1 Tax=Streptomyces sp. NE06-03E TaxID=3028695 RepID=UPI0029B7E93E|nr:peptidase dimerization domain-containing protein [Streptomyces sp. NE06-03E]MDX3057060.1 peptidase dimerization domain-containing protein [Streptomyces sp. NE06-03E]
MIAQTAVALARQRLPPRSVVSTITTEGGSAVNVIPARTRATIEMRSPSLDGLRVIQRRVRACLEAGALATGCALELTPVGNDFADLRQDTSLSAFYRDAMISRGREVKVTDAAVASTDMGNVSHLVPSIHPLLGDDVGGARRRTPPRSRTTAPRRPRTGRSWTARSASPWPRRVPRGIPPNARA